MFLILWKIEGQIKEETTFFCFVFLFFSWNFTDLLFHVDCKLCLRGVQLSWEEFHLEIYLMPGSHNRQKLTDVAARKEMAKLGEKHTENAEFQKVQRTERGFYDKHFQKNNQCSLGVMEILWNPYIPLQVARGQGGHRYPQYIQLPKGQP